MTRELETFTGDANHAFERGSRRRRHSESFRSSVRSRLSIIAIVAVFVRVVYILVLGRRLDHGFDATWFHAMANMIADGRGYRSILAPASGATAQWPPGYPAVLAALSRLGGRSLTAHRLVGAVIGGISVFEIGLLGRRIGGDILAVRAAAIAAVWPALVASDASLMSEVISLPLVLGMFLVAYNIRERPTIRGFIALGVLGGLGALVRQDTLLVLVLLVALLVRGTGVTDALKRVAVVALVFVAIVTPWAVRNTLAFHRVTLVSTELGGTLEGANCAPMYSGAQVGLWSFGCLRHATVVTNESADERRVIGKAARFAREHATRLPLVLGARLVRTWGFFPRGHQLGHEADESRWAPWQYLAWGVELVGLPLAIGGLVMLHRNGANLGPLLVGVAAVCITSIFSYGLQRFRLDAEPAIILGVAALTARIAPAPRVS